MLNRGSEWRRWEPHIHGPGTVLNNQFKGANAWDDYIASLEAVTPKIEAIAVTDYYVTDTYEEVARQKSAGRLPDVQLIFPNIELRLDVAAKTGFVNVHLLISPEDPNHLEELRRILSRFQFPAFNDRFDCTRNDLIRLGRLADPNLTDDRSALEHGATQFKVNFAELRKVFKESEWAQKNILIGVAGSEGDGTSGVRQAADKTMREEIEKFAHVIFASSAAQREFWLGQRSLSVAELRTLYRHFPTRDELIEGVYRNEVGKLAAAAARFAETMSPLEALRAWMLLLVDYIAAKHIIAPALNTIAGGASRLHEGSRTTIHVAIDGLVKRAKRSGDLRRDLDAYDLLRALIGVSHVGSGADWQQSARRLVDILIAGSRPLK